MASRRLFFFFFFSFQRRAFKSRIYFGFSPRQAIASTVAASTPPFLTGKCYAANKNTARLVGALVRETLHLGGSHEGGLLI